ncbi:60S ribosomal protein L28-like [Panthera tigris]|uniref:60S ribosomal protein L28-like n=1 Tax=Panthera tigris TaxID=9694 RepID=UPI001C6F7D0F|nr:60S ribosomal protein L28-like [Panthera tigris]XP_049479265.1 60S ribosomal protein L28-like [Panthera uncia]XP_049479861.1 60S ribosomal protein L28-like [Panthera uncia]
MSAHLQWVLVGNGSSFLIKWNEQIHNTEPTNLKAHSSFCYNGLIHCKTVGVGLGAEGKGIVVVTKHRTLQQKPATSNVLTTISKNAWAALSSIWPMIHKNSYGPDLCMPAIHRASAILCSQKPVTVKRKEGLPTKSS